MAETGHAVNIANLKVLIARCTGFGTKYNPSNPDLTIANMTAKWTTSDAAQTALATLFQGVKEPINDRQNLFKPINKLTTRMLRHLNSTKASANAKEDAKGLGDKIRGVRPKKPKITGEGTQNEETSISNSQQSYVQKANFFLNLLELLKTITEYAPNEDDLKITALQSVYDGLKAANDGIDTVITNAINARIVRNDHLYAADTGVVAMAGLCKNYVQGVYGTDSPYFRQVSGIAFRGMDIEE